MIKFFFKGSSNTSLLGGIIFFVVSCTLQTNAQIKVGDNPETINAAAIIEAESTSKGILLPRLTTVQMNAISSPPNGLIIFNTTEACLYYFHNGWKNSCDAQNLSNTKWESTSNFIYARQAAETGDSVVVTNDGKFGIATSNPDALVSIKDKSNLSFAHYMKSQGRQWRHTILESQYPRMTMGHLDESLYGKDGIQMSTGVASYESSGVAVALAAPRELGLYTSDGTNLNEVIRIKGNGNVGIGTNSPVTKLHTIGIGTVGLMENQNSNGGVILQLENKSTPNDGMVQIGTSSSGAPVVNLFTNTNQHQGGIDFYEGSSRYLSMGSVFLNNQHVSAKDNLQIGIDADNNGQGYFSINKGNGYYGRLTDGTNLMTVLNNGNVGIGTDTPTEELTVQGASSAEVHATRANRSHASAYHAPYMAKLDNHSPGDTFAIVMLHLYDNFAKSYRVKVSGKFGSIEYLIHGYQGTFGIHKLESTGGNIDYIKLLVNNRNTASGDSLILGVVNEHPVATNFTESITIYPITPLKRPFYTSIAKTTNLDDGNLVNTSFTDYTIQAVGDGDAWGVTGENQSGVASRTGNVGIGTTNPNSSLHIQKGVSGDYRATEFINSLGGVNDKVSLKMVAGITTNGAYGTILSHERQGSGGGDFTIKTNPTLTATPIERFRISKDGNVGIGTGAGVSLNNKFHVWGDVTNGGEVLMKLSSDDPGWVQNSGDGIAMDFAQYTASVGRIKSAVWAVGGQFDLGFMTGVTSVNSDTPQMILTQQGRFGVGTTSPSAQVEIVSASNSSTTEALVINNSDADNLLEVADDGFTNIGANNSTNNKAVLAIKNSGIGGNRKGYYLGAVVKGRADLSQTTGSRYLHIRLPFDPTASFHQHATIRVLGYNQTMGLIDFKAHVYAASTTAVVLDGSSNNNTFAGSILSAHVGSDNYFYLTLDLGAGKQFTVNSDIVVDVIGGENITENSVRLMDAIASPNASM